MKFSFTLNCPIGRGIPISGSTSWPKSLVEETNKEKRENGDYSDDVWSTSFRVNFGVRQGSVLSPFLFNIYLYDLAKLNNYNNRSFVIVNADDILLIAQSASELQKLLSAWEHELQSLDMVINIKKSCCLRIGPRCNVSCANISSQDGRLYSFFMGFWTQIFGCLYC